MAKKATKKATKAEIRKPRVVGYLRVSTADQDLEKFKAEILTFANQRDFGKVEFVQETVSGFKTKWRNRKLKPLIDSLEKGDKLIVPELSRLGRSMLESMEILSIAKNKEIDIYDIKNGWELNGSIQSKVLAMAFSIASEIERDLISKRTKEGLAAARAKGKQLGRPKGPGKSKLDKFKPEIIALLKNGSTKKFVAKRFGASQATLQNWLLKNKIDAKPEI